MTRPVPPEDVPFLKEMVYEGAFHEAAYPPAQRPSFEEALADPRAARFVEDQGRPGDLGVVGFEDERPVGEAALRTARYGPLGRLRGDKPHRRELASRGVNPLRTLWVRHRR